MNENTSTMSQIKACIAKLANSDDWGTLTEQEREALYREFTQWWVPPAPDLHPDLQRWAGMQDLKSLLTAARASIRPLLQGQCVKLSLAYEAVGQLQGRKLNMTDPRPKTELDPAQVTVEQVLQVRPFPFGLCARCDKVFVHPPVGRRRRFCSSTCQINGAPGQRAAYMQTYRQGQRRRELTKAKVIVRDTLSEKRWQALQSAFPEKSYRQLVNLMKRAEQREAATLPQE